MDWIGSSGQTLNYQSKRYTVINGVKVSSKWMACSFKHFNNELPGLENNFFLPVGLNLANPNKTELPRVPSPDLDFHWWSFSLCLSFSKSNISYLEWDFYISVTFASNTLNMTHVVRLQMLIKYKFSVTIIWCPKFRMGSW